MRLFPWLSLFESQPGETQVEQTKQASGSPKRISIVNQKGGVGKTTLTFHLSGALAAMGRRVLAVDCDSQGSLSSTLLPDHESLSLSIADIFARTDVATKDLIRATPVKGLFLVPADERLDRFDRSAEYEKDPVVHTLADALTEVEDDFDFLLFDCPPRRSLTTFASLVAADEVLVPVECDVLSLHGIVKLQRKVEEARRQLNPKLFIRGYVLSRFQSHAALQRKYKQKLSQVFGEEKILATIPEMRPLANAMSYRQPITTFAPKSRAAAAIRNLAEKISNAPTHVQNKGTAT